VSEDLRGKDPNRQNRRRGPEGGVGAIDKLAAEGPVPALDHHVKRSPGANESTFLDQVAVEGSEVDVAAIDWIDGDVVLAVVEADGAEDGSILAKVN
jgi:hypothetical protein